ncbi:TetR/AcrR family transcriptional regulator [Nocardia sp. NPDC020380]|uniref:TetR/AcrR family transcriptional regulator n=1 Tax=Nocardia sp. NPDC020380 TaxID=3364309 RepID=UPI0037AAD5AE
MPRKVDPEQQERQKAAIAEAVWRLAARAGLESVSLREVANEAGVSMGRVQHYFRTKDEMLLYGLRLALHRMDTRIEKRLAASTLVGHEDILRAALAELFGDDEDTLQAIRVSIAYLGRALDDAEIAQLLFEDDVQLRELTADAVRVAQAEHRTPARLDPEREAHVLWSLANSLTIEVACGQTAAPDARAIMDYHLERTFGR